MADEQSSGKGKRKEGVSVQELENFGKKYQFEIFFIGYFVLAAIFSFLFFGPAWSIYLGALGGILGIWLSKKVDKAAHGTFRFVFKQDRTTQLVIFVGGVVVAIFLAPLIFFILGLMGGSHIYKGAANVTGGQVHSE